MKYIKKSLKVILMLVITFIIFILVYFLAARGLSSITVNKEQSEPSEITMYIHTNGMHTDYVFPIKSELIDWSEELKFEHTKSQRTDYNYVALGWGDKGFFLDVEDWAHVKLDIAVNAAFGLGTTAMHTTFLPTITEGEDTRKITISKKQYQALIDYARASFKRDTNGQVINIVTDKVYGMDDSFYEGEGNYSFLHTCNSWANSGLKLAKMRACLWTPFQEGIFRKYE
ncbi:TIGR02117 family protein [Myroides sp. N17-2]|uniref:TIGR02117 family protein n=1 Tax=Myroides sp. N17-2 TaxID=2030799 RepID=UPI000EFB224D|nr:TIGR02117 family protein [Myroides sp. N17-2]